MPRAFPPAATWPAPTRPIRQRIASRPWPRSLGSAFRADAPCPSSPPAATKSSSKATCPSTWPNFSWRSTRCVVPLGGPAAPTRSAVTRPLPRPPGAQGQSLLLQQGQEVPCPAVGCPSRPFCRSAVPARVAAAPRPHRRLALCTAGPQPIGYSLQPVGHSPQPEAWRCDVLAARFAHTRAVARRLLLGEEVYCLRGEHASRLLGRGSQRGLREEVDPSGGRRLRPRLPALRRAL